MELERKPIVGNISVDSNANGVSCLDASSHCCHGNSFCCHGNGSSTHDCDSDRDGGVPTRGLSLVTASVFLIGELAGTGVMSLPYSLKATGYIGLVFILLSCYVSYYMGYILGECWQLVQARYPQYRGHVRHPYPTLADITFGTPGRLLVSFCANFTMFGAVVSMVIMISQNVHSLLDQVAGVTFPSCIIMVIVAVVITPFTWFGTPKDFWLIALGAMLSTMMAVILSLIVMVGDVSKFKHEEDVRSSNVYDFFAFFQGLGTILYSTGGHYAFLTFQNDMKQPQQFGKSLVISYSALASMYIPFSLLGYIVYGRDVASNIVLSLSPGPITYFIIILVSFHQCFAIIIVLNPLVQHLEEVLHANKHFSWHRMLIRTVSVLAILFVALTVPRFGLIISLLGGSANLVTIMIAPPLCYLKLSVMKGEWPTVYIPLHIKVFFVEILVVGLLIGVVSTSGNFMSLWGTSITLPCYVSLTATDGV